MRSLATTFVGVGLACSLAAQADILPQQQPYSTPAAAAYQLDRYQGLEDRVGGMWFVHYHPATKTPESAYGSGIRIEDWRENTLQEGRRHADSALRTYGDLLKLGTSEYREAIGAQMGNTWCFVYDQYFQGVPCVGGRADVRINKIGVIAYLGSVAYQLPSDFDVRPNISEEEAVLQSWFALGERPTGAPQPPSNKKPRLVIWADLESPAYADPFLAWEIPISNLALDGSGKAGRYYIDAKQGKVLHYQNDKHDCGFDHEHADAPKPAPSGPLAPVATTVTVMAWTRTGLNATDALVNTPVVGLVVNVPGIGSRTTDASGQFSIDIAAPVTITVTNMDGIHNSPIIDSTASGPSAANASVSVSPGVNATLQIFTNAATPNQAAHTSCQFWLHTANEWVRSIVGNSSQMNTADSVTPTVNIAATCNAFYTGNTVNFYAAGGSCNNTAFSTVMVHEWGHGIDDRYGGISNANNDGLSEGWGDIFGMYHPLVDNPITGAGFFTTGGSIRTGLNTTLYTTTQTDPHAAGEVWMGFAWRLRDNLRAAFGTPQAIAISNTIVIGTVVANATNRADAVTQVFIADDDNGNLNDGVPHYAQLSAAATLHALPFPQIQVATVSTFPLGNTTARYTPRLVTATAAPIGSGTITDVRMLYTVNGGGTQTRHLIPNGAVNGYQALLPGIGSGTITYHLEAVHSTGAVVRTPASTEIAYSVSVPVVGPFVGFFLENFEGTAPGWTHVRVSGASADDWQLGIPNGKTGTSLGVAWADPGPAVSSRVFGTDLGAGTSNGSYPASMNYYLLSPSINCSGRVGCYLRFRRWLQVEEATFDHATVLVNNQVVWTNPVGPHTQDTSWQTFEYAIPMADNNPLVQIEFLLTSDGGLQLGGWNIDDVEVGTRALAPFPSTLQMLPEQAATGTPMVLTVLTPGPQPFVLGIGDTQGPTLIPGGPPVLVGGNLTTLGGFTNALGLFQLGFTAFPGAPPTGLFWYSQVVTLDATSALVVSNQHINLFTP